MKGRVKQAAVYVRVSTGEQNTGVQETELKQYARRCGWVVHKVYRDHGVSGTSASRPALDQLMADCRRKKEGIDVVLVWKFDRFARSLRQLTAALEEFRSLEISFCSATENIDTSVPHGELVFQILAALAQWERALIGERVAAGVKHARSLGKRLGRPPVRELSAEEVKRLKRERARHHVPFRQLAQRFGVSVWTAYRLCQAGG